MTKYAILVQIIDKLRQEAPKEYKRYHPKQAEAEKLKNALSRSFIHLYLKVKFGLLDFKARERLITDDADDGGLDAYYIDKQNKTVHLIQSKFRDTASNFEEKQITIDELVKMEVDEIVRGQECGENQRPYNGKIKQFQRELSETEYLGQYKYKIVVLANFKSPALIEKMYPGYPVEVFDYSKAYPELVFPVVSGTYFRAGSLHIQINLDNISGGNTRVSYSVATQSGDAEVTLIFAPVREIGAMMSKYRNSILEFNPRSYLGLAKNSVNDSIRRTVVDAGTNEFALFNNGITIVADEAGYSDKTGKKSTAHLDLVNPQIINGGQTAYTLCKIYDEVNDGIVKIDVFDRKEVLLKIITIDPASVTTQDRIDLIEKISKATNHQTKVDEVDRRSNETIQIKLQELFYSKYGLFYERKAGEFYDGLEAGYIDKKLIVDREQLMRVALAKDFQVSETRARIENFFSSEAFSQQPLNEEDIDKYAFGYACYQYLSAELAKARRADSPYFQDQYGSALRYGRFAVVAVAVNRFWNGAGTDHEEAVTKALSAWKEFETWVAVQPHNQRYLTGQEMNWVSYHKGETINQDLEQYGFVEPQEAAA